MDTFANSSPIWTYMDNYHSMRVSHNADRSDTGGWPGRAPSLRNVRHRHSVVGAGCAFRNMTYRPSDYASPSGEFGIPQDWRWDRGGGYIR